MEWKGRITRTPYLVLFVVLLSIGVGTASAMITITLAGNVHITGDTTTDGKVGIGTSNPDSALHVIGSGSDFTPNQQGIQLTGSDSSSSPGIEITGDGEPPYIDFQNDTDGTDFDARIILYGDDSLVINGANLGIGTTSPTEEFDVNGDVLVRGSLNVGTQNGGNSWDTINFHDGSKFFRWQYDLPTQFGQAFQMNDDLFLSGDLEVGGFYPFDDDSVFFDGTEFLMWDDDADNFEISNDLIVNGSITSSCPSNMSQAGQYCIDNMMRGPSIYNTASLDCMDEGMVISPVSALFACDLLNLGTSDCGTITDGSTTPLWTSDFVYGTTPPSETFFDRVITYIGNNTFAEVDTNSGSPTNEYFCTKIIP